MSAMRKTLATITSSINARKSNTMSSSQRSMISEESQEQSVRDMKLSIEFKSLKQNAPSGVYILPSLQNIRHYHGVIFVRRGAYANAVFKFTIKLPPLYNGINTWPQVTFTTFVYNPFINPTTGELNIKEAFPRWDPQKHYLVTLLTYIKKIFYIKTFDNPIAILNTNAYELANTNIESYKKNIKECVLQSQQSLLQKDDDDESLLKYPIEINGIDNDMNIIDTKILSEQLQYSLFWEMLKEEYIDDCSRCSRSKIIEFIKDVAPSDNGKEEDKCCIKLY